MNKRDNTYNNKVLKLAVYAGELLMKNGAEIYRVEDTIIRICTACGVKQTEVFATMTGIFISLEPDSEEEQAKTYIKRIDCTSTDLNKISKINEFSRNFVVDDTSVDQAIEILRQIDQNKPYPEVVRLLGAAIIAGAFCLIFGGSIADAIIAVVSGTCSYLISLRLTDYDINFFIRGLLCCAVAAFITLICVSFIPETTYKPIMIGTLMIYVPGVAITNSIRDFLSGSMLSGLSRMADALITAASLATGTGLVITLWHMIGGVL